MKVKIDGEFKEYTRKNFKCELENKFPRDPKNPFFYNYPHDESLFSARYGIKVFLFQKDMLLLISGLVQ